MRSRRDVSSSSLLEFLIMKNSKLTTRALTALAIAAGALLSQAQAAVIFISPASQNANVGDTVGVDIFVSGLTQALGGFAFDLNYDATRLSFTAFQADPDLKMGDLLNPALNLSLGNSGASVNFDMLAGFVAPADEATLFTLQGSGAQFRLGHIDWTALNNPGNAPLTLSGFSLSDYNGAAINSNVRDAAVCVGGNCTNVPEPTTPLLVAAALGALALSRKNKQC
jgi:hypothetical protein